MLPFILITIDAAAYEENGGWYVYAKATNPTGTLTYVSTPKMIIVDVKNPKAIDFSTGKELVSNGKYWGRPAVHGEGTHRPSRFATIHPRVGPLNF